MGLPSGAVITRGWSAEAASGGTHMRVCLKVQIPVEAGNTATANGKIKSTLKDLLDRLQPEAAYFFPQDGMRTWMVFFNMEDTSQMPVIGEPLFDVLHAKVAYTPVMNLDDLMEGLKRAEENR
jgi:hypothetical protein